MRDRTPRVSQGIAALEPFFRDEWPTSAATWLPVPEPWSLFRNPVLAETYTRVLEGAEAASADRDGQIQAARDAFYRGFVAEAIGAFCEREWADTSGERHRGLLEAGDPKLASADREAWYGERPSSTSRSSGCSAVPTPTSAARSYGTRPRRT